MRDAERTLQRLGGRTEIADQDAVLVDRPGQRERPHAGLAKAEALIIRLVANQDHRGITSLAADADRALHQPEGDAIAAPTLGHGDRYSGVNLPIAPGQPVVPAGPAASTANLGSGAVVPDGWLVLPHDAQDGSGLTAQDVARTVVETVSGLEPADATLTASPNGVRATN